MEPTKEKRGGVRPGAGRPRKYEEPRAVIGGSVPKSTAQLVKEHAESSGQTISDIVGQAVIEFIKTRTERRKHINELVAAGTSLDRAVRIVYGKASA